MIYFDNIDLLDNSYVNIINSSNLNAVHPMPSYFGAQQFGPMADSHPRGFEAPSTEFFPEDHPSERQGLVMRADEHNKFV